MLRHIILVSLAMTACANLIPTKANAARLTLEPVGSLRRNPNDSIEFVLALDPNPFGGVNEVRLRNIFLTYADERELRLDDVRDRIDFTRSFTTKTTLARFIFTVLQPVRDRQNDLTIKVDYRETNTNFPIIEEAEGGDVRPVPEPLTIFGTATALGCGVLFKRKSSKKTIS